MSEAETLPVITADITGHSKFCKVTQTILNPSVPEIPNFSNNSQALFVIVVTLLPTTKGWKAEFGLFVPGVEPVRPPARSIGNARMNMHAHCESVGVLMQLS